MKRLKVIRDAEKVAAIGTNVSNYVDARVLAANTAELHTVPTEARYVLFSANADFYAKFGGAAVVPAADVSDGSGSILNPGLRSLDGAMTIGLISATVCIVTMEFWA